MTEDEAKTKWCPFARLGSSVVPGYGGFNRDMGERNEKTYAEARCVASACAVWQWNDNGSEGAIKERVGPYSPGGYCGLGRSAR